MTTRFDLSGLAHEGPATPAFPIEQTSTNTDGELERIQIQFDEGHFAFAIVHPLNDHWSGYALMNPRTWEMHREGTHHLVFPRITYTGFSTSHICWMEPNLSGRLTKAVTLTPDTDDDYWVGFDLYGERVSHKKIHELLISFATRLWSLTDGRAGT